MGGMRSQEIVFEVLYFMEIFVNFLTERCEFLFVEIAPKTHELIENFWALLRNEETQSPKNNVIKKNNNSHKINNVQTIFKLDIYSRSISHIIYKIAHAIFTYIMFDYLFDINEACLHHLEFNRRIAKLPPTN